jgi:hypothetical protein
MIIVMNGKTDDADVEKIVKKLNELGHEVHIIRRSNRGCGKFSFCSFLCL